MNDPSPLEAIFFAALEKGSPQERAAYLEEACAGDPDLRRRVEKMLAAQAQAGGFLEQPAHNPALTVEDQAVREAAGTVIGPYKLVEPIGEGGMGTVWMARQTEPVKRVVALKLIKAGMDSKQVVARFEVERQALALMDHPNIARVLDVGTTDAGRPYFVMDLVKGVPITRYCDERHLAPRQRLELFIPVCQAVQHAHQKGIIHRDLKPSNVLIAQYDGAPVPKVIDFGVAKATGPRLTEATLCTEFGSVVGTLEYMSPEQAELNQLDIDTRSDIYSLGVLLYELLTGTTPFTKEDLGKAGMLEMLRVIREQEPTKPSSKLSTAEGLPTLAANRGTEPVKLTKLVRGELDWIVMKALEKDRNRRYETANGFALDVQRYLADEPVMAGPPSAWYHFRKFTRRNRTALVTATAAAMVVVAGLATSNFLITRQQRETAKALHDANAAKDDLKRTNDRERVDAYFRRIALAHAALSVNDLGGALRFLDQCPEELCGWEWRYLMRLCRVDPVIIRGKKAVYSVAFAPDGERLASADGDGAVRVWNSKSGEVIREIEKAHVVFACCVAFHPQGNHLASVGADGKVKVWDLTADPPRNVFERPCDADNPFGTAYAAAFSPLAPDHLAVGYQGTVTIWDWKNDQRVHPFPGHETDRICVAFSPDGRRLATGNWQGTVKLFDAVAGRGPLHTFTQTSRNRHPVAALAFSPDGMRLAAASYDRRVDVWDTTTGRLLHSLPHPGGLVLGVAFSRDGLLASVGEDKVVRVWDATGRELLGLRGHTAMCGCVAFSPDGLRLASAGSDGTVPIRDATPLRGGERQESASFEEHRDEVWSVALNPVGPEIVSAGWSMPALVWDAETRRVRARFRGHRVLTFCVAWHPDGHRIASAGSADGEFTVKVWDATTETDVFTLRDESRKEFFAAAFSADGRYLVTGRRDGTVHVWDANDGQSIRRLGTHKTPLRGVVFSPAGPDGRRLLATASADGVVKLWDATRLGEKQEQEPLRTFLAHSPHSGLNVAFSPDGKRLVMSDKGYTLKICDVESTKELLVLRGHNGDVHTVAFSPDGRWVASAGEDSTLNVWDSNNGELLRTFRGHTRLVSSLAFTRDGRSLVSGSRDHTVKFWDVAQLGGVRGR
jgi:WD40 repeat protein/serine/threonine protein kinase